MAQRLGDTRHMVDIAVDRVDPDRIERWIDIDLFFSHRYVCRLVACSGKTGDHGQQADLVSLYERGTVARVKKGYSHVTILIAVVAATALQ
jgi:hypothetical protein